MFHNLNAQNAQHIPVLAFVESYIYQVCIIYSKNSSYII